ncbi:MAG TPA: UvrD-helicase domain-containing protein, partial [Bellilinea sp.]|nr:UvrD-helicase domain-containing protein [Bellilinea sp.]
MSKDPTPQQERAITAPINAHVVLEAVPGSGKTFVIERRLDYLVQNGVDPSKILVVTFSKSQADDMGLRIFNTFPYL